MRAPEQVLVHLFCFLLSPFLCAGPDRILIESKQFINLKSCLRVAIQLVKTFNAHLLVSYWKKIRSCYGQQKPFGQTLFSFVLLVCFLQKESHMIIILSPSFSWYVFFKLRTFVYGSCAKKCGPRTRPSLVMYKVTHFHTGVAFTEEYPRRPESVSKVSKME